MTSAITTTTTTRRRQRQRRGAQGAPFLFLLVIAAGSVLWLEGIQIQRFNAVVSYLHRTATDLAGSLDFPPESWKHQPTQSFNNYSQSSPSSISTTSQYQSQLPDSFNPNVNVTDFMLQVVQKYNQSTCVCPELIAAAKFVEESRDLPRMYNITVIQLMVDCKFGSGKRIRDNSTLVRSKIFESNKALLQKQGIDTVRALTRRPFRTTGMATPNFWKMEAMLDECKKGDADLVWFLDADIVLLENVAVDVLWAHHAHIAQANAGVELDMLLAKDWRGIYAGSAIVNCKSPTAMQFLQEWKEEAIENLVLDWKGIPGHLYLIEANAVHELNSLRWLLNLPNWVPYPFRERRSETAQLAYLRTRVHATLTPCALATYHPILYCEAKTDAEKFEGAGRVNTPLWYEPGHQAVHITSDIERLSRNDKLLESIPENLDHIVVNSSSSLKRSAKVYLKNHVNKPSIDPLGSMTSRQCRRNAKAMKFRLRMWRNAIQGT